MFSRTPVAWIVRSLYALTVLGSVVRTSASSLDPSLIGQDPWHQHVVLGPRDRLVQQAALRNHAHRGDPAQPQSPLTKMVSAGQALVVSIVDQVRAVLSSLADSAGEAALAPMPWLAAEFAAMTLLLWTASAPTGATLRLRLPTPPPRPLS